MGSEARDQQALTQAIESLRGEVARLSQRVAAIEGVAATAPTTSPSNANHAFGAPITDEALICVISAALAAYLGVQPRIRQIRLVGGASWANTPIGTSAIRNSNTLHQTLPRRLIVHSPNSLRPEQRAANARSETSHR